MTRNNPKVLADDALRPTPPLVFPTYVKTRAAQPLLRRQISKTEGQSAVSPDPRRHLYLFR